jgi:hypothetical protein
VSATIPTRSALAAAPLALVDPTPWRERGASGSGGRESGRARTTWARCFFSGRVSRVECAPPAAVAVRGTSVGSVGADADAADTAGPTPDRSGAACGPCSRGAAPGGNGRSWSGTAGAAGNGGIAGGIATSTMISDGRVGAGGRSSASPAVPVSNLYGPTVTDIAGIWIESAPGGAAAPGLVVAAAVSGRAEAGGWVGSGTVAGAVPLPAGALPQDQVHAQSQLHVRGVPAPACVVIVSVWPQNVNVHVQFQGSVGGAVELEELAGPARACGCG